MSRTGAVLGLKVVLWLGALGPATWLVTAALRGGLGANPIEKITHVTGLTTLSLLLVTLAVTPVRRLTGWNPIIKLRRPLGLFAFFYACLHLATYVVLDLSLEFVWVAEDIRDRPYITVGFSAFVLLTPLAFTSTRGWIRRLGHNWTRLHRLVYVAATLGVIHFYWLVKADTRQPLLLGGILLVLLATRVQGWARRRQPTRSRAPRLNRADAIR